MRHRPSQWLLASSVALLWAAACASHSKEPASQDAQGQEARSAKDDEACLAASELDKYQLLRRLSLDLRGKLPSYEEYTALDDVEDIPEATLDSWLEGDDYRLAMRAFHESILWPNPEAADIAAGEVTLRSFRAGSGDETISILAVPSARRRSLWRIDATLTCGPWLQTEFDDGIPVAEETYNDADELIARQEGYVMVEPYWAPGTQVAVCAYDAMAAEVGVRGAACDTTDAFDDPGCGCGPELKWCYAPGLEATILEDLREQFGQAVDEVTVGGALYSQLLTSPDLKMNGRLAFWKTNLAHMVGFNRTYNAQSPGDPEITGAVDFTDERWQTYTRGDSHSGILTLAAWTLRFQTNRARANRFRIAFTGQSFVPPSQPEDPETAGCDAVNSDLTQMCTCRGCHQVLEPLAAHFAPIAEAGSATTGALLEYEERCDPNAASNPGRVNRGCGRFYATGEADQNPGWLLTHQYGYRDDAPGFNNEGLDDPLHRSIYDNIVAGPTALAQDVIGSGQLASTTVKNLFEHLVGRPMILNATQSPNELELLTELATEFEAQDDFTALVRRIIELPQYRRTP